MIIEIRSVLALAFVHLAALHQAHAQVTPQAFSKILARNGLQFVMPPGYSRVSVVPNEDVAYDFAIKSDGKKLEIRYRVWPLRKSQADESASPNQLYKLMLETIALNISNGKRAESRPYPPEAVKSEFGADAGSTIMVDCRSAFGSGYTKCLISVIHKDNTADAYALFLFDEPSVIMEALSTDQVYHALKFQ